MHDRLAPWELDASPLGFVRTWASVTFRPKAFLGALGDRRALRMPALYGAVGVMMSAAVGAAAIAATTYSSLHRFDATDGFGRLFARELGWYLGELVAFVLAAGACTWLVAALVRRPPAAALGARMYTLGPLTSFIAWWLMFRWIELDPRTRGWRARALAVGGWLAELALALTLASFLASAVRDGVFALFFGG